MALDNLISVTFTDSEVRTIENAIKTINRVLENKVINLTPDERRQYGSIADRNRILVDKCKDYMEQDPETIPRVIDKAEFDRDYKARQQLQKPLMQLARITEKLQDTKTLLDHDNYQASIAYYRYIKYLASENEAGTSSIYKDLKKQYQHQKKAEVKEEKAPTESTPTDDTLDS